jgi:thiamine-phosphate pyrophosphorylase
VKPLSDCRLYAFVDTACLRGRAPERLARELCDGGADLIQLRAKLSLREEILRMAQAILPVTRQAGVGLVINDHLSVAQEVGAEACHLGQEDFFGPGGEQAASLRSPLRPSPLDPRPSPLALQTPLRLGLSTHGPEQAKRALAAGADYLGIGPVYPTGTKPQARPVTLEYVRWAAANVAIPWFAIGGITLDNLDAVLAAGARRICAVSAILNARDVAAACRQFKDRLLAAAQ